MLLTKDEVLKEMDNVGDGWEFVKTSDGVEIWKKKVSKFAYFECNYPG